MYSSHSAFGEAVLSTFLLVGYVLRRWFGGATLISFQLLYNPHSQHHAQHYCQLTSQIPPLSTAGETKQESVSAVDYVGTVS